MARSEVYQTRIGHTDEYARALCTALVRYLEMTYLARCEVIEHVAQAHGRPVFSVYVDSTRVPLPTLWNTADIFAAGFLAAQPKQVRADG